MDENEWMELGSEALPEGFMTIMRSTAHLLCAFEDYCRARNHEREAEGRLAQTRFESARTRDILDEAMTRYMDDARKSLGQ